MFMEGARIVLYLEGTVLAGCFFVDARLMGRIFPHVVEGSETSEIKEYIVSGIFI